MPPVLDLTAVSYAMCAIVLYYAALFGLAQLRRRSPGETGAPPLVAFLVPARNEEAVLEPTVWTALKQSYEGQIRVLIVDDASIDGTGAEADGLAAADQRVRALHRDPSVGGSGKSAVLNHGYASLRDALAKNDPWLDGARPEEVCLCILDADGHLSPTATTDATRLLSTGVGAVQIGVHIRNARDSLLARLQDLEFVGFSYMVQVARDRLGSVGLGGNGQYTRFSALSDLGETPWRPAALTEDLDLGLRLQLAGWRLRFCSSAYVDQEGLTRVRPLLRQRTRWTQGHYQCWRYVGTIFTTRRLPLLQRLDTLAYLTFIVLVILTTTTQVVDALGLLGLITPVDSFLSFAGDGTAFRAAEFLVSWLPVMLVLFTYQRFSNNPLAAWEQPAFGAYFAIYAYSWAIATLRGWFRLIVHRGGWTKTPRVAVLGEPGSDASAGAATV